MSPYSTHAILIERHGPPEVFVERKIPLRDPNADEVHVRVQAVGLNFADLLMRGGLYDTVPPRPYSPGFEIAGVVARVGADVSDWREGDPVVALLRYGGYARDVIVPAKQVFRRPASLSPVEAAAIPVAFLTGYVCLFECGNARPGETALILGAGGGVGTAAVQLAVRRGLRVFGTAGAERKRAFVVDELGAQACFDSRGDWERDTIGAVGKRGIDVALDSVGGPATKACRRLLAPLGRLVFYGLSDVMPGKTRSWLRAARAMLRMPLIHPYSLIQPSIGVFGVHLLHLQSKEEILRPALAEIFQGVESGELHAVVDQTFSFDRAGAVAAHKHVHARQNLGKVLLAE
jgi:NADPH:quinone reductase-like Zn-dependent oxidoreductase